MLRLIDVVGDVHGHLAALRALGRHLGYDVDGDWEHPQGRVLVFLGDLVDRGAESLAVAMLVKRLVERDRAVCLMGNHEYNLVDWKHRKKIRCSNKVTIGEIETIRSAWDPALDFFAALPLAIDLPDLRIIHAVWHRECYDRVRPVLGVAAEPLLEGLSTAQWLRAHVALESPYDAAGLRGNLPLEQIAASNDRPHEVLIKGHEDKVDFTFKDADGNEHSQVRTTWWSVPDPRVDTDKAIVFGHYWNVPPIAGRHPALLAPPYPSGHPDLREWQLKVVPRIDDRGIYDVPPNTRFVCVDYNGVYVATRHGVQPRACIGALRWPANQVAWACAPAT